MMDPSPMGQLLYPVRPTNSMTTTFGKLIFIKLFYGTNFVIVFYVINWFFFGFLVWFFFWFFFGVFWFVINWFYIYFQNDFNIQKKSTKKN